MLTPDSIPAILSPRQYAELTGTNLRTVQYMCATGRLPAKRLPGSAMWRISGAAVRDWLQALNAAASPKTTGEVACGDE